MPREKSKGVEWELRGDVGVLRIGPPPHNYLKEPDFMDLQALRSWTRSPRLKGVIVTGQGRHFSAGADIESLRRLAVRHSLLEKKLGRGRRILMAIENLPVPTIAAVRGVCFGGGFEIALACHIRVCGERAVLALPESNLGLIPGLCGTVRLPRIAGMSSAMRLILTGNTLDARGALEKGIADYVVPDGEVLDFSMDLMRSLTADRPVEVIRSVVAALNNTRTLPPTKAMEEETRLFCRLALKEARRQDLEKNKMKSRPGTLPA